MANFLDALNVTAADIKKPKALPVGTYLCQMTGQPNYKTIGQAQTPIAEFTATVRQPMQDVDAEQLAEFENGVAGKTIRCTFFLSPDALYRFKDFMTLYCGIDDGKGTRTLADMASEIPGKSVLVKTKHRPGNGKDGQMELYTDVESYAAP